MALSSTTDTEPAAASSRRPRWRALSPVAWLRALATVYAVPAGLPRLHSCPECAAQLLSRWGPGVTARGRCAACGHAVGRVPWVVEIAVVVAVAARGGAGARGGGGLPPRPVAEWPAYGWFAALGVVLGVVDAVVRRLPNVLTLAWAGGTTAALLLPAVLEHRGGDWLRAVLAGTVLTVLFGAVALLRPGAMGWGDVKAAAAVGVALGWLGWAAVYGGVLLAFLLASVFAVVLLVRRRAGRRSQLALGPFLVIGALVVIALAPGAG
jgi:leader peptidase (prepilin peptidase)/N-methyltransferase